MTKRGMTALATAGIIYLLSWLTPVAEGGTTLAQGGVPGWEAFRGALAPIWPYRGLAGDSWFSNLLSVMSGLSNLWFVMSLAVLAVWPRRLNRAILWGLALLAVVNALWLVLSDNRADLRIGYYLWLGSFVVLAATARFIGAGVARSNSPGAA